MRQPSTDFETPYVRALPSGSTVCLPSAAVNLPMHPIRSSLSHGVGYEPYRNLKKKMINRGRRRETQSRGRGEREVGEENRKMAVSSEQGERQEISRETT